MQAVRRFPVPESMAIPKVSAFFTASVDNVAFKNGAVKVTLEIEAEQFDPGVIRDLAEAQRDGGQTVVLVSKRREQEVPGTEEFLHSPDQVDRSRRVAIGLQLHESLVNALLDERDPASGAIEGTGPRTEVQPIVPVGTWVGGSRQEAATAVRGLVENDPDLAGRAAGTAAARGRHPR